MSLAAAVLGMLGQPVLAARSSLPRYPTMAEITKQDIVTFRDPECDQRSTSVSYAGRWLGDIATLAMEQSGSG
jgi:hypothetical protein